MSAGYTPGPWVITPLNTTFKVVSHDGVKVVSTSWHDHVRKPYPLKAEARANVYLIAAAPDLYEALTKALDDALYSFATERNIDGKEYLRRSAIIDQACAALAKARGDA